MRATGRQKVGIALAPLVLLCISSIALATQPPPSACVEQGALAWDNWTTADAGGSGMPAGESDSDYLRCKACHGWDRLGSDGGSTRLIRDARQPNAGAGDSDTSSRNISPGLGNSSNVTAADILHQDIGRSYFNGSGSWTPLNIHHTAINKARHARGFTMGNQHPDFSAGGINSSDIVLTQEQADCLAEFINFGDSDPATYFKGINTRMDPVLYTINTGGSGPAGKIYYDRICLGCHGDPATDHNGSNNGKPEGGILAFLAADGNFSEFVHKARWGIPDTDMTRVALDFPDSQDMVDLMTYMQEAGGTGFAITGGISGTWIDTQQDAEGFLLDVSPRDEGWVAVVSYYFYNNLGEQVWVIGSGIASGNFVITEVIITGVSVSEGVFDRTNVEIVDWGTIEMEFSSCELGHVILRPNQAMLNSGLGFDVLEFDIRRLTQANTCP